MAPIMTKNTFGQYTCDDYPKFVPNLSPQDMFTAGIFGGTYFRDILIGKRWFRDAWREFEEHGYFDGLDIPTQVASQIYNPDLNRYGVKCGQGLDMWLEKGWIKPEFDSHGWVHWYCRFFLGRRCADDARQISRWNACAGEKGRWKRNLIAKCVKAGRPWNDENVSPVVRQTLLHWGYQLTEADYDEYEVLIRGGARTSFIRQDQMAHVVEKGRHEKNKKITQGSDEKDKETVVDEREERRKKRARRR